MSIVMFVSLSFFLTIFAQSSTSYDLEISYYNEYYFCLFCFLLLGTAFHSYFSSPVIISLPKKALILLLKHSNGDLSYEIFWKLFNLLFLHLMLICRKEIEQRNYYISTWLPTWLPANFLLILTISPPYIAGPHNRE